MKNVTKKALAVSLAIGIIGSGSVFAQHDLNKDNSFAAPIMTTNVSNENYNIKGLEIDNKLTFPLRKTMENLGYVVTWNEENSSIVASKGERKLLLAIDVDEYAFGEENTKSLGIAPVLVGDTTYVPAEVITDILGYTYEKNADDTYTIKNEIFEIEDETFEFEGEILSIYENKIFIGEKNPEYMDGGIAVIVSTDTVITKGNDKRVYTIEDLEVGMVIKGTNSASTTASIPPQVVAKTIVISE